MADTPDYSAESERYIDIVDHMLRQGKRAEAARFIARFMHLAYLDGEMAGARQAYDRMSRVVSPAVHLIGGGHA
jgi:hypothetical protein